MKSAIPARSAMSLDGFVVCVLLSLFGVFGNYIHIELFFSVDFLFGGIAALLAMSILGWYAGSLVGFIASLYTYVLWGHPYAILIFTCEAIVVGFLSQRKYWSLASSEVAYWFTIGIPLVYYCYHGRMGVPSLSAWTIALKQASNGLFCAFLVSAILFLPIVHRWISRLERVPPRSLQGVLVELTIAFAFFAMLFSISLDSNLARKEAEKTVYEQLKMVANNTLNQVAVWQQWNGNNTKILVDLIRTQYYPIELTITLESKHPDFRVQHNSGASSIAPLEFSTVHYIRDRLDQYFPVGDMPSIKRWRQSVYQWRIPPSGSSPWSLTIASSAAPQIMKLEALYSAKLLRLLATTGAIVLLSNVTAYIISQPITRLNQALTDPQSYLWAGLSADRAAESDDSPEGQSRPEPSDLGSVPTIREFRNLDHHIRQWVSDWQQQLDALTHRNAQLDRLVLMASEDYENQASIARVYEQASIETRQRLNAIVQYTPIVMIEWRLDRSILAWNPAAEKLFGYASVEVLGRDLFSTILPDREAKAMLHTWQNLVDLTGGHNSTHETITKEGKTVICDWFNRPILTRGGAILSIISVLREVAIVNQSGFLSKSG